MSCLWGRAQDYVPDHRTGLVHNDDKDNANKASWERTNPVGLGKVGTSSQLPRMASVNG
jgi:hypothetical protein